MRVSSGFSNLERVERQAPPPHPSPLKGEGMGGGVGLAAADHRAEKAKWVRQNLPVCSAVAAEFKAVFGDLRLTYAAENGHVIGKQEPSPGLVVTGEALLAGIPMRKEKP